MPEFIVDSIEDADEFLSKFVMFQSVSDPVKIRVNPW